MLLLYLHLTISENILFRYLKMGKNKRNRKRGSKNPPTTGTAKPILFNHMYSKDVAVKGETTRYLFVNGIRM